MLKVGRVQVHKLTPFTICLVDRLAENSTVQPVLIKIDPSSKMTGLAIVREDEDKTVSLFFADLKHRGDNIRKQMTQRATSANLRYRAPRFNNRTKSQGWLPPSLQDRVDAVS